MADRVTIKRRAHAAVFAIIDSDDEIVAGTWALTGPPVLLDLLYAVTAVRYVPLLGQLLPPVELLAPIVGRSTYVAVTRRRMICIRLSWPGNKPGRVVLDVPVSGARISGGRRGFALDSVRYTGPGVSDLGVSSRWQWRSDVAGVLAALRAGGASVELTGAGRWG